MKKRFVYSFLAALAVCSCQVEEVNESALDSTQEVIREAKVFTAIIDDTTSPETRTSLDAEGNVLWKQGDQVSIFAGSTINEQYQVTDASDGKTAASLNKVSDPGFVAGTDIDHNVAFYPYVSTAAIAKSAGSYVISDITLPATQTYAKGSFGNGAFPMAAVTGSTDDMNLKFKNVLGGLKLQLKGTASIASISITGNNNEVLCGATVVTVANGDTPSINLTDASAKTVTLDCGAGVALDSETATPFIIALPPITMTGGFTVIVTDTEGKQMEIKTTKSQTITRSSLLKMPAVTYEGTYSINPNIPKDALPGIFSVGVNKKVHFSRGNLQYTNGTNSANGSWGFAEQQYEIVGETTSNTLQDFSEGSKVDLFCWSGDSKSHYGLSSNTNSSYYDGLFLDWGRKIDNNETWRTLSADEWSYLIGTSEERNGKYKNWVNVNGVYGLVLAPDTFVGTISDSYDASTWAIAENDGLVFLPISGYRCQNYISNITTNGYYWSSTTTSLYDQSASDLYITSSHGFGVSRQLREYACFVRLVNDITSPTAVDLGLSVKWASCNVGARNPFGLGQYYAWGEIKGFEEEDTSNIQNYEHTGSYLKLSYSGNTYKYCSGDYPRYTITKYHGNDVLEPNDDPASVNWGAGWRAPTKEELEELLDPANCSWTWYGPTSGRPGAVGIPEFNGVPGYKVQSLKPGFTDNYIFLPASGYRSSSTSTKDGKNAVINMLYSGYYWTSSLSNEYSPQALIINSRSKDESVSDRYSGYAVRPVTE